MYTFESRIRYSEINYHNHIDIHTIINYFQDCSTFHSEDIGVGLEYFKSRNLAWFLSSWQINVTDYPKLGDYITIGTWASGFQSLFGSRNYIMKNEFDRVVACANSIWVLMDTEKMRPVKLNHIDIEKYEIEDPYPMDYKPRKIAIPKDLTEMEQFCVVKRNLDTNHHVNNGEYVKMAEEYLPTNFAMTEMRAEYKKSAVLGDIIIAKRHLEGNVCTIVLAEENGNPYTILQFTSDTYK